MPLQRLRTIYLFKESLLELFCTDRGNESILQQKQVSSSDCLGLDEFAGVNGQDDCVTEQQKKPSWSCRRLFNICHQRSCQDSGYGGLGYAQAWPCIGRVPREVTQRPTADRVKKAASWAALCKSNGKDLAGWTVAFPNSWWLHRNGAR